MHRRRMRLMVRSIAVVVAMVGASLWVSPASSAQSPAHFHAPDLVVLGDSYASGVGNTPYLPEQPECKRSNAAYGPLLARLGLVTLQAFVACSGATTWQVSGPGPNGETPPQIDSITRDTDVVTVRALGNDFFVGEIEFICLTQGCTWDTTLKNGDTIRQVVDSIPTTGRKNLDTLYGAIRARLRAVHAHARVIAVDYPSLFGDAGGVCSAFVKGDLADISRQMAYNLDHTIKETAAANRVRYAPVSKLFARNDICDTVPAIYLPTGVRTPGGPAEDAGGALHPNQLGQALLAGAVASRLFF